MHDPTWDSLWVRGVTEAKRRKPHLLQTWRAQASASKRLPKSLAVGWQFALAGCGDGDEDDLVLQQLLLHDGQWPPPAVPSAARA